jgi:hypothetical protein
MALSEAFPPEIVSPARVTRSRVPITARELVEWTYAVQRAQGVPQPSLEPQGRSQTGIVVDRMIEFAQLGCKVDVSSNAAATWGEARCDEDAIAVHQIVRDMPVEKRALLIHHGLNRSAPEWSPMIMPLRCIPVPGSKNRRKGIYSRSNNLIGNLVTYEGDWPDRRTADMARAAWPDSPFLRCADEVIAHARDIYRDWVEALISLANWLDGVSRHHQLRRYVIQGIGASHEPGHGHAE